MEPRTGARTPLPGLNLDRAVGREDEIHHRCRSSVLRDKKAAAPLVTHTHRSSLVAQESSWLVAGLDRRPASPCTPAQADARPAGGGCMRPSRVSPADEALTAAGRLLLAAIHPPSKPSPPHPADRPLPDPSCGGSGERRERAVSSDALSGARFSLVITNFAQS
ncbi:hypothetical protein ZWY2020_000857 [Hordeum vulgare]|nr:hypothetical protein ZWY2020_000857 [Hordeum vulgare]